MKFIKTFESYNSGDYEKFINEWTDFIGEEISIEEYNVLRNDVISQSSKPIYRTIMVDDQWIETFNEKTTIHLGVFWTTDNTVAKNWQPMDSYDDRFESKGNNKIILQATVTLDSVDIHASIAQNFISSESEIRLIENSIVTVVGINISYLYISNKTFLA